MDIDVDPASVLLVARDQLLIGEVTRLAAAAGAVARTVTEPPAALAYWASAGTVLVGPQLVGQMAELRPPRRTRVHVLTRGAAPDRCYREALAVGAESVGELPGSESWLVETLTDRADGTVSRGLTVGIVGGSGGVGASVFAAGLAQIAGRSRSVLLVDGDPLGPGLDRMLGMEQLGGVRWDSMVHSTGRLSGRSMRESLPGRGNLSVLSWPADDLLGLEAAAMREVLSAGSRGFSLVVVDLPRHHDPVVVEALSRCDHVVLLVAASVPGVAAAARVAHRLPQGVRRHLVVRSRRASVPPEHVADVLSLSLVATLADQRGLEEAIDLGVGPVRHRRGPLAKACTATLAGLADVR